jgi:hypothetical protein
MFLVAGQHQAFYRLVPHGAAEAHIEADVDLVDAQRLWRERGFDRIGQMIIEAGLHLAHEFAEAEHHAEFIGFDAEETGKAPQRNGGKRDQCDAAAPEITRQQAAQFVLAHAQKFLDIGWSSWSRPPRATRLAIPRHDIALRHRSTLPGSLAAALVAGGYKVAQLRLQHWAVF